MTNPLYLNGQIVLPEEEFENIKMIVEEYNHKTTPKWLNYLDDRFKKDYGVTIKQLLNNKIYWVEFRRGIGDH